MELKLTAEDFQNLVDTAMEWDKREWEGQELRFDFKGEPDLGFIYWVESYTTLVLCEHYLSLGMKPQNNGALLQVMTLMSLYGLKQSQS